MIRSENRNILHFKNESLLERLSHSDARTSTDIVLETSKNGAPTLKKKIGSTYHYMHSQYNPVREAESFVSGMGDVQDYDQVLFIGAGLGYIIKAFSVAYPDKKIYVYEPELDVLDAFLEIQDLSEPWAAGIRSITNNSDEILQTVGQLLDETGKPFYFSVLPFYERNNTEGVNQLLTALKERLINRKSALVTDFSFQQRWILNAVKNFLRVMKTPNILMDLDPSVFKRKPVILIAAGPSLNDELDHLRKIKTEGSAYLFAVGSAINALISHDIIPDAFLSYDPTEKNQMVAQLVKDRGLSELPLIFGSTVGFETLEDYPGPMCHVVNIQDTLSPLLLQREDGKPVEAVYDAPSIAIITMQILLRLQADPIILVGQNLAYLNSKFYAQGISYDGVKNELSENQLKSAIKVKDVLGNEVLTSRGYDSMRKEMEMYIGQHPECRVINTTRGGAAIAHTPYQPMDRVLEGLKPGIVVKGWYDRGNGYNPSAASESAARLLWQGRELKELFGKVVKALRRLKNLKEQHAKATELTLQIEKANQFLRRMQKNNFFQSLIVPMMRVQVEHFNKVGNHIRTIVDAGEKTETVLKEITVFLNECIMNYRVIFPLVEELRDKINA
ncbi:motility associated factor glycosyltransferase family protein [Sporolactobacillus shoreae]|nr:6-hydroxymethylpterin diphosphokinase MptE-like protein [Sporolactobacillus shoreae]